MKKYRHVFFDLDHTLWDFEKNSTEVITELLLESGLLQEHNIHIEVFLNNYKAVNNGLWKEYREGKIDRKTLRNARFHNTFLNFGINNARLAAKIDEEYIRKSPFKKTLFPHTYETLDYLKSHYTLHIITNGFEEVQHIKLKTSGINHFFTHVITSDSCGFNKPQKEIFEYAMSLANATAAESLMVGDNLEIDVLGAKNAGLDQVYFNPLRDSTPHDALYEIHDLKELMHLL